MHFPKNVTACQYCHFLQCIYGYYICHCFCKRLAQKESTGRQKPSRNSKATQAHCKCCCGCLHRLPYWLYLDSAQKYKLSFTCSVLFVSPGCVCVTWLALSVVRRLTTKESVWKKQETSTRRCSFWENASMLWDTISRPSEGFIHPSFPLCLRWFMI